MQNFHLGDVAFCNPCKYVPSCIMPRSGPSSSGVNIGGGMWGVTPQSSETCILSGKTQARFCQISGIIQ